MKLGFNSMARPKRVAKSLRNLLLGASRNTDYWAPALSECQGIVAALYGYDDWHALEKSVGKGVVSLDDDQVDIVERIRRRTQFTKTISEKIPELARHASTIVDRIAPTGNRIDKSTRGNVDTAGRGRRGRIVPLEHPGAEIAFALQLEGKHGGWVVALCNGQLRCFDTGNDDFAETLHSLVAEGLCFFLPINPLLGLLGYAAHASSSAWLRNVDEPDDAAARSALARLREQLESRCDRQALAVLTDTAGKFRAPHYAFYAHAELGEHRRAFAKAYPWAAAIAVEVSGERQVAASPIDLGYESQESLVAWLRTSLSISRQGAWTLAGRLGSFHWPLDDHFSYRHPLMVLERLRTSELPTSQMEVDAMAEVCALLGQVCSPDRRFAVDFVLQVVRSIGAPTWTETLRQVVEAGVEIYRENGGFPRLKDIGQTPGEQARAAFMMMHALILDFRAYTQPACLATRYNLIRWLYDHRGHRPYLYFRDHIPAVEEEISTGLFFANCGLRAIARKIKAWHDVFGRYQEDDWKAFSDLTAKEQLARFAPMLPAPFSTLPEPATVSDWIVRELRSEGYGIEDLTDEQILAHINRTDVEDEAEEIFDVMA